MQETTDIHTPVRTILRGMLDEIDAGTTGYLRAGNDTRVFAIAKRGSANWEALAATASKPPVGEATHVLYIEYRRRAGYNDDDLSVTGRFLQPRMDWVIVSKTLWIIADASGRPDLDYLCRAGGALAKLLQGTSSIGTL